jgi:hypothetical protein
MLGRKLLLLFAWLSSDLPQSTRRRGWASWHCFFFFDLSEFVSS